MERQAGFGEHEIPVHGAKRRKCAGTDVQAKTSLEAVPTSSTITRSQTDTVGSLHQDVYNILKTGNVKFLVGKLNLSQNHTVKEQEVQDKFLQSCGRYRHDIIPDGNSLYRAVVQSLYGDQSGHLSLRQQTLSCIESAGTYHLNITGKPHHFFSRASQLGDWIKVTEIAALSYILHVNIHVLTCDKDCIIPPKFQPRHFGGPETTRDIYISWLSTGHFDAITDEQKPNPEYSQWFQQQLSSNKLCVVQESDINKSCSANEIQTPSMTETQTRSGIYEFNAVLHDVANELGQDEFQQLLLLCKGIIPKSTSENLWNCMDLFQILEDQGLISRRDASFLIDLLTRLKRMDLVEKVKTHHPGSLADGISWIKTHLRKKYKKHYRNFKPIPWNENMSLSLTEMYTRLKVTKSNERKRFKKGKILTNEKAIFGKNGLHEDFARIQIEGAPGMGKSTLCRKLAYDWACGDLPQYQLLFLLEMRHVTESSHQIEEIIFRQLLPDKAEITLSALVKFINQNQSSILFLFDGLDEMKFRANVDSSVIKTIQQKQFSWCTVVTTTRPHECDNVLMESDVQFMVEGFSLQDAMKYIKKYFNNKSKAQSLISELKLDKVPLHRSPLPYLRAYMDDSNGYTNDYDDSDDDDTDDADDNCTFDRHDLKFTFSHVGRSSSFYDMTHYKRHSHNSSDDDVDDKIFPRGDLDEYFQCLPEKDQRNLQRNAEDFHIQHDLLCNPLHVAFVCLLWDDKRCIPTNMTNTYSEILECILRRCCCKSGIEMASNEIPKKVQDDVNCLASLAYKAMFEKNMILNERDVPPTLLSLGLLVRDTGVSNIRPEKLCFFYHKTWLEYFTALQFCKNVNENVNDMESTFEHIVLNEKQVGLFVAGILKDKAKSLLPVPGNKMVNKYWYNWKSDVCSDFCDFFQFTCAFCREGGLAVESLLKYMPDILILSDMIIDSYFPISRYNEYYNSLFAGTQCGWLRDVDESMSKEILSLFKCQKKLKQQIIKPCHVILQHGDSKTIEYDSCYKDNYCMIVKELADHCIYLQSLECYSIWLQVMESIARALQSGWCLEALKLSVRVGVSDREKCNDPFANLFQSVNVNQSLNLFEMSFEDEYRLIPVQRPDPLVWPLRLLIDSGPEHVSIFMPESYHDDYSATTISHICEFIQNCKQTRSFSFTLPYLSQSQIDNQFLPALKSLSQTLKSIKIVNSVHLMRRADQLVSSLNASRHLRDFKVDIDTMYIFSCISLITKIKYLESLTFQLMDHTDYSVLYSNVDSLVTALLQHSSLKHFCLQMNDFTAGMDKSNFYSLCTRVSDACYNAFKHNQTPENLGLTSISLVLLSMHFQDPDYILSMLSKEPFLRYMTFTAKCTNIYHSKSGNLVAAFASTIEINFKGSKAQEMK